MNILKIEIRHSMNVNLPVNSKEEVERFRKKLIKQCRIEPDDKVEVYFITRSNGQTF